MQKYERKDTAVCIFDKASPRITAYEIHEWIYTNLHLETEDVVTIQIDGPRRQVYIKTTHATVVEKLLLRTKGESIYEYDSGERYKVIINQAGLGRRNVRVANLPPEMPEEIIRQHLRKYGQITTIKEEKWANTYRYNVANGVRIVQIDLQTHIPSHLYIEGYRALISYIGQPSTCYICGGTNHVAQECPARKHTRTENTRTARNTWANIVENGLLTQHETEPDPQIDLENTNSETTTAVQKMRREMDSMTTNDIRLVTEMGHGISLDYMEHQTGNRVGEEDRSNEAMDTIEIPVVAKESNNKTNIGKGEETIDSPPNNNVGTMETETHSDGKQEETASNKRFIGKKIRQHSDDTEELVTKKDAKEEYPALPSLTDDEQETVRPPHIRKKKPRTDIDATMERRDSRSSRYRRT
jgi:hypothetical protein